MCNTLNELSTFAVTFFDYTTITDPHIMRMCDFITVTPSGILFAKSGPRCDDLAAADIGVKIIDKWKGTLLDVLYQIHKMACDLKYPQIGLRYGRVVLRICGSYETNKAGKLVYIHIIIRPNMISGAELASIIVTSEGLNKI